MEKTFTVPDVSKPTSELLRHNDCVQHKPSLTSADRRSPTARKKPPASVANANFASSTQLDRVPLTSASVDELRAKPVDRTLEIVAALRVSDNRSDVARQFGISRQRVHQIAVKFKLAKKRELTPPKRKKRQSNEPHTLAFYKRWAAMGGKIGGKIRAAKLTPEQRRESARKAIAARWAKRKAQAAEAKTQLENSA